MVEAHENNAIPTKEQSATEQSHELAKLIRKLRWVGLREEACRAGRSALTRRGKGKHVAHSTSSRVATDKGSKRKAARDRAVPGGFLSEFPERRLGGLSWPYTEPHERSLAARFVTGRLSLFHACRRTDQTRRKSIAARIRNAMASGVLTADVSRRGIERGSW
jgi:hypothetical protein